MRPVFGTARGGRATTAIVVAVALATTLAAGGAAGGNPPHRVHRRAQSIRVDIHEFAYRPHKLTVARGTKVVFANGDPTAHTATSAGNFRTGHIRPGHSAAVKLEQSGVYAYHCSIHHFMHGKIVVE